MASEIGRELMNWCKRAPGLFKTQLATEVAKQASRLADAQRAALQRLEQPPEESGAGLASIRVEKKSQLSFLVLAGGPSTTVNGYDHMLGFEFGTQHQPARPFFYSTARAMEASMRSAIENAAGGAAASVSDD